MMRCASAVSTARGTTDASREVVSRVADGLGDAGGDLAVAFVTAEHADGLMGLAETVRSRGLARHVLGVTAESIAGDGREYETGPALALWVIRLPGVRLTPIRLEDTGEDFTGWPEALAPEDAAGRSLLLLADPFRFRVDEWLSHADQGHRGMRIVGGMASAAQAPGRNRLLLDDGVYREGAIGMAIEGSVDLGTVVSQGCRPIGRPMIVTKVERNLIHELGRRPAIEVIREQFEELSESDRERVRGGLHLGRVLNEYQEAFRRGDFLVRNVMGATESGALAVNDFVRVGQTVQLHVRDSETADEDLRLLLRAENQMDRSAPVGALLFTCNGRGTRLFPSPDHDVRAIAEEFGPIPTAGFFAMGEIGPIGGRSFVHGFTASLALFRPVPEAEG